MLCILNSTFSPVSHTVLPDKAVPGQLSFRQIQQALHHLGLVPSFLIRFCIQRMPKHYQDVLSIFAHRPEERKLCLIDPHLLSWTLRIRVRT